MHRLISHQIAAANQPRHRARAAYLAIADIVVYMMSDELISRLGVGIPARSVVLSRASQRHIVERRRIAHSEDAQLAADRVKKAFEGLRFRRLRQRRADTFELVGFVESADRWLLIVLKLVPADRAKSAHDEWWLSTAYPLGRRRFRRLQGLGDLELIP